MEHTGVITLQGGQNTPIYQGTNCTHVNVHAICITRHCYFLYTE